MATGGVEGPLAPSLGVPLLHEAFVRVDLTPVVPQAGRVRDVALGSRDSSIAVLPHRAVVTAPYLEEHSMQLSPPFSLHRGHTSAFAVTAASQVAS